MTAALAMALGFGSVAAVAVTASTASSQMQSTGGDGGTTACGVTSAEYATAPPPDCDGGDVAA